MKVEKNTGLMRRQFECQRERFADQCLDFGKAIGFDGKAIESHSTGRKLGKDQRASDPDAA